MTISALKNRRFIILGIAFVLSLLLFLGAGLFLRDRTAVYLAVAGPTGGDNVSGTEMVQGIELYLDRLNEEGGINGKKVKLKIYDDRNDPVVAKQVATKIVRSNALAVLGHFYSSTSLAGGKIYQSVGIPAISASATADSVTQGNNWYSRVIFNNQLQAAFIANYVNQILERGNASIIYSDDDYGKTLRESFVDTFEGLGGKVKNQWALDADAAFEQQQQQIVRDLLASKESDIIFCATHNDDVVDLIVNMRRKNIRNPLIGADSLGSVAFAQKFKDYTEEQQTPGYFSEGIYAVAPIIYDIANEQAQKFRNEYINKYAAEPSWAAATYYDAAALTVEAISQAQITELEIDLTQARRKVRASLNGINSVENAISGLSGKLYFDRQGDFDNSIYIGTFNQRKFISAFTQLQPVDNLAAIENLQEELDAGRILAIDSKYRYRTNIVYTGIDINEIRNLDEKTSSYLVDFYLWFRFQGDIDADNIEFTNYGTDPHGLWRQIGTG